MDVQIRTTLSQRQFDEFARLSGDDNPIHVDHEFSARTRFGRTVSHGMFLFSILQAELARAIGGPVRLAGQEFVFSAPTYAGDPLLLTLCGDARKVHQQVVDSSGNVTAAGVATVEGDVDDGFGSDPTGVEFKGLRVGMSASRIRRFTPDDVADYLRLVADPNPLYSAAQPELPPSLLGGIVSALLGVDLPGYGTMWLKQHDRFHSPVSTPAEIVTTVTITGIRPEKGLVNLAYRSMSGSRLAASGESLVLATDVAPR